VQLVDGLAIVTEHSSWPEKAQPAPDRFDPIQPAFEQGDRSGCMQRARVGQTRRIALSLDLAQVALSSRHTLTCQKNLHFASFCQRLKAQIGTNLLFLIKKNRYGMYHAK